MREALNLGGKLLLFTLIAAVLLAGTNMITKDPIAEQQLTAAQSAQRAVLPGAEVFEEVPLADKAEDLSAYSYLTGLFEGKTGDQVVGYVLTAAPMGYGGPIPITVGVGTDGSLHGVSVGDLQETSGLGSRVGEEPFLSQFTALEASPETIEKDVDTISGVTVSSTPFKEAVRQMTAFTRDVLGVEPHPGQAPLSQEDLARQEQLPQALAFDPVNPMLLLGDYDAIRAVYRGVAGEETVGYVFDLAPMGFVDVVELRLAIDEAGRIASLQVISNQDSEEYGQRISREPEFIDSFIGKDADAAVIDGIDALSGATGTSDTVKKGVTQAANFYRAYLAGGTPPTPDAVSGATGEQAEETPEPTPDAVSASTVDQWAPGGSAETATPAPTEDAVSAATVEQPTPAPQEVKP